MTAEIRITAKSPAHRLTGVPDEKPLSARVFHLRMAWLRAAYRESTDFAQRERFWNTQKDLEGQPYEADLPQRTSAVVEEARRMVAP